jgi:hypothetical protein
MPPLSYYVGFLEWLRRRAATLAVGHYPDLPWSGDVRYEESYPAEHEAWRRSADPARAVVLLHHDVDARPDLALAMLREEAARGIRSTVLLHVKCMDRPQYEAAGRLAGRPYEVDDQAFLRFQEQGFAVGYHQNALDQARFDFGLALRLFESDVWALRHRGFACRFTTAHGGLRGPRGEVNNQVPMPDALRPTLRWTGNRWGIRVDGRYSDSEQGRLLWGPLHEWVGNLEPGRRYAVLVHPQYYEDDVARDGGRRRWPEWEDVP